MPPPPRGRDLSRSPGSRPAAFLGEGPHLAGLEVCLSPRRGTLPGCSPLPPGIAGLREPPHLPGLAPLAPLAPRPPLLLPGVLRGPPGSSPLPPRPLLRGPPPPAGWRPLGLGPGPRPLMRPGAAPLRPPLGGGMPRPGGGPMLLPAPPLVPMLGGMQRGGEHMADWAPLDDGASRC